MKKNLFIIGMGAMALATPLFLSSCSSSDDIADTPATNNNEAVKTSFTLSVGLPGGNNTSSAKPATRMTDATAQAQETPVFRGMDNMTLIPFVVTGDNAVGANATRLGSSNVNLPNAVVNSLTKDQLKTTGNAKVYTDVSVPLTTNAFLFYGKAIDDAAGTDASTVDNMFKYGTLTKDGLDGGKNAEIKFTPSPIAASPKMDKGNNIATYLTNIANAKTTDNKAWSAVQADAQGQGKALQDLYAAFTKLSTGSSNSIQQAVQDLYTSMLSLEGSQTTENKAVVDAVKKAITDVTYASVESDNKTLKFTDAISGYPEDNNLPDGAATVKWETSKFTAQSTSAYTSDAVNVGPMANYVYPANLWYRANTRIKTSDQALSDQYVNGTEWKDILAKYNEDNGVVKSSTRSIALKNQIQYAVARLDTKVTTDNTLYDHNHAAVSIPEGGFPVTGILVGGQRQVDWEFHPVTTSGTAQYTIYDKNINKGGTDGTTAMTTSTNFYNHTLCLESASNQHVYMVVELQNNSGNEFHGYNDEVIPAGSKFYMVAELNPEATSGVTQPTTKTGSTFDKTKVFQQDFTTIANLKILRNDGTTSGSITTYDKGLGAAYNVIPDLRTPALSIGLSVDLTWQAGLTFNVDM